MDVTKWATLSWTSQKTLRDIPDRDESCEREATNDGTQIILKGDMGDELYFG